MTRSLVLLVVLAAACKSSNKPCEELKKAVCADPAGCEGLDAYLSEGGALSDDDQQAQCKAFLDDPETLDAMKRITSFTAQQKQAQAAPRYTLVAKFRDGSGLPRGTRVVIGGATVGEVTGSEPAGRSVRVTFAVDARLVVRDSATLTRQTSATLGESFLELAPGASGEPLGPSCAGYDGGAERCREVVHVVESALPPG
ncbi:MAG: MCE family protein [Deltaproteobacteria bacterium]|nr:MCE family protein [Deltaproteobacteria bacterium]